MFKKILRACALRTNRKLMFFICFLLIVLIFWNFLNYFKFRKKQLVILDEEQEFELETEVSTLNTSLLINLEHFNYAIDNNICQRHDKNILAVIIITSYVGHDALRAAHRKAISRTKLAELGFERVFLLARIPKNERYITQEHIQSEQLRFGDLVQGNFMESYRNLSYKHIMGLQWAGTKCAHAKYIIKIDDDIVYDIFFIHQHLVTLELKNNHNYNKNKLNTETYLAGYVLGAKRVIRNSYNKWFVTKNEYTDNYYPAYLSGWLYITNPITALRFVNEALHVPFFWIDDVWVTGILRKKLNIMPQNLNYWYAPLADLLVCCIRDLKAHNIECGYYVGPNGGNDKMITEFMHNAEKCYYGNKCIKRKTQNSLRKSCDTKNFNELRDGSAAIKQIN